MGEFTGEDAFPKAEGRWRWSLNSRPKKFGLVNVAKGKVMLGVKLAKGYMMKGASIVGS